MTAITPPRKTNSPNIIITATMTFLLGVDIYFDEVLPCKYSFDLDLFGPQK